MEKIKTKKILKIKIKKKKKKPFEWKKYEPNKF